MIGRFVSWLALAQEAHGEGAAAGGEEPALGEMIMHHIVDSRDIEFLGIGPFHFPEWTVHLGGTTLDLTITKHVFYMLVAALLLTLLMTWTAWRTRGPGAERAPRGFANLIEAFVIYIRDDVAMANIGHGGERFVPYILTLFFFILFANLLGLLPWGATATANLSVTAALALLSFLIIEVSGFVTLGPGGYAKTIFFWPHGMSLPLKVLMFVIMTPVELLGKLTKPFALAIRLFANMNAGHFVLLALIGLVILAGGIWQTVIPWLAPVVMAIAIMILELFVSFLQAYIFAMLTSVFIGLIRHAH